MKIKIKELFEKKLKKKKKIKNRKKNVKIFYKATHPKNTLNSIFILIFIE